MDGCIHTIKKNTKALVVAFKENSLEVNSEKIKYVVMSPDQNAGQNHNIQTDNKSFESMEQFKYLGTTITNQGSIQEALRSRL